VIWVAGCSIRCPGCINPHLLDPAAGRNVRIDALVELMERRVGTVEGITISGGEPTDQAAAVTRLATHARRLGLSVLLFSGRSLEECRRRFPDVLGHCDILVAGPFVAALSGRGDPLRGSSNQDVHFLGRRYGPGDLVGLPEFEISVQGDRFSMSGIPRPR